MIKCPVSGCGIFHDRMLNCKVAKNQLLAGTLAEPYLAANRLERLVEKKAAVQANVETPLDQPVIPVVPKKAGVDRPERRPMFDVPQERRKRDRRAKVPDAPCKVCEARKVKERERVARWRAKKP